MTIKHQAYLDGRGTSSSTLDSASFRFQILAAEHWSLLATRSLTYNESLSRVIMFLSVLSGAVVALALLAEVDHLGPIFAITAMLVLSVVLFVGIATIVRLTDLNGEDMQTVIGMNRLRRGYLDLEPTLEPYFITGSYDDLHGLMLTMGMDMVPGRWSAHELGHGLQTLPNVLGVIVAVVAGVLAAVVTFWFGLGPEFAVPAAAAVFLASVIVLVWFSRHAFATFVSRMPTRFPSTPTTAC